jgi:hypothetical protein
MLPSPTASIPSSEDVFHELSTEDNLPSPEIHPHIAINVVSHLNAVEEARSLSIEEQSLCEFLLDQILFLQESLEQWMVPCIVEELLGCEDFPSPLAIWGARWRRCDQSFALRRWEPR